jgi:protein-S-isoprenylcysteine O-methyltransferase Ste14
VTFAEELTFHHWLAYGVIATGAIVALALRFISAPYGRHERDGWGPRIRTRWAWMIMESPAVYFFATVFAFGQHRTELIPCALLGLWMLHYVNRAFVFPLRMKDENKQTPVAIAGMAIFFNLINAYLNARWISHLGNYPIEYAKHWTLWAGTAFFLVGRQVNLNSDRTLFRLREKATGYQIPHGGLYELISSPNYFGELVEWSGWALATYSLAGLSFALFTAANLVPRAVSHHRWYRERFADYPSNRKAVIPFVL